MIYTIYTRSFDIPGAMPNQYSFESFESKKAFIEQLKEMFEENREPIETLDGEEALEELDAAISEMGSLLTGNIEHAELSGLCWSSGSFECQILLADSYPSVAAKIVDTIFQLADDFEEYDDLSREDISELHDDERYQLYKRLKRASPRMRKSTFEKLFSDCGELLSEDSVF